MPQALPPPAADGIIYLPFEHQLGQPATFPFRWGGMVAQFFATTCITTPLIFFTSNDSNPMAYMATSSNWEIDRSKYYLDQIATPTVLGSFGWLTLDQAGQSVEIYDRIKPLSREITIGLTTILSPHAYDSDTTWVSPPYVVNQYHQNPIGGGSYRFLWAPEMSCGDIKSIREIACGYTIMFYKPRYSGILPILLPFISFLVWGSTGSSRRIR
jgi:hypothetical protein